MVKEHYVKIWLSRNSSSHMPPSFPEKSLISIPFPIPSSSKPYFECCRPDAFDHYYKDGDAVPLYANEVGPFHNPSETYHFFDLLFCSPDFAVPR
ncbi:hypothetical protein BT93_L3626 [Corymbia citriodora subsp. variegata]|uniref:Uncharacterized protein n=1 Tax=Corymbia citriodora subsp. variegata TaxID=360336 RepID=A0A8T0CH96_CORYI|nr:hypothetical protein BT93_L3626 [Corymbia citriodora subsp. variegata]